MIKVLADIHNLCTWAELRQSMDPYREGPVLLIRVLLMYVGGA